MHPLTLRGRLLLTIAVISTVVSLLVGGGALLALRQISMDQLDTQLESTVRRGDFRSNRSSPPQPSPSASAPSAATPGASTPSAAAPSAATPDAATPSPSPSASAPGTTTPSDQPQAPDGMHTPAGASSTPRGYLRRPGITVGTLAVQVSGGSSGGTVEAGARLIDSTAGGTETETLSTEAAQAVLPALKAKQPITVAIPGLGDYRVIADEAMSGSTMITGLSLAAVQATTVRLAGSIALFTFAGLAAVLAVGSMILRLAMRPLDRVRSIAVRVSELPLERGEVALAERVPDSDPRTEVGQVGTALNRMLEHVARALSARQQSETRLRQFVSDASHELRTPLASIRGYAELVRRRPDPLPEDVDHALGRVESEAQRMTGLVEDLLMLARLDEGRPLESEVVDLTHLITNATSDAKVAGPDHTWLLDAPEAEVVVLGDEARLTQVILNLLTNARTHTPAGTEVRVQLRQDGEHARLVVADNGPGIPDGLAADAFERFTRGDSSRNRAAGSTGLGLAIVDAVVRAHGGTVDLDSAPGRGTRITVRLPALELSAT